MIREEIYKEELLQAMQDLKKEGYKGYIFNEKYWLFGYVITPRQNVIYIQRDTYDFRGWTFTLKYKPSRKNGSGCQCLESPIRNINKDILIQAEKEGLLFAKKLKAELYKNVDEFLASLYNKEKYQEVL